MTENTNQTESQWQRFWRSPWTWLALASFYGVSLAQHKGDWLTWGVFILMTLNFFWAADKRWGKP